VFKPFTEWEPCWQQIMPDRFKMDHERCHLIKWLMIYQRCFFNFNAVNQLNKEFSCSYKQKQRAVAGLKPTKFKDRGVTVR